jgi:hypothetical protein
MKLEFSRKVLKKISYAKFHENPFRCSRIFQADGQAHMTKPTLIILNLADAPKTENKLKNYSFIT